MKILCLQHVEFESPSHIIDIAAKHGHEIQVLKLFNEELPTDPDTDVLVVMGGPMSIHDEGQYPWLNGEKKFIKQMIHKDLPVIGICLGAQMIASSMGAGVYPGKSKEIGWYPVQRIGKTEGLTFLPDIFTTFHWHGDTFDIPIGAERLYKSDITANQAFVYNNRVFAFQFHMELTLDSAKTLIQNCRHELKEKGLIMDEKDMIEGFENYMKFNHRTLERIFKYLSRHDE